MTSLKKPGVHPNRVGFSAMSWVAKISQPPGLAIAIDQLFGRSDITAAVLKEICPEKVQVSRSGVELLAAPSTTREVFFDIALRPRARVGKGIGKG